MLYVTTRGTQDAFTAYRAIRQDRGPDGGFFVPMIMPIMEATEMALLSKKGFGQNVADILNVFFGTKLSGWDVDVTIGRRIFSTEGVGHRILMGHLWNDLQGNFDLSMRSLAERIVPELSSNSPLPNWLEIGIRIGILFGVFGELFATGQINREKGVDVAVSTGSFAMPMALWYARKMGLPIRRIICGCNENGAMWDLLHRGEVDTAELSVKTTTPSADFALPPNLERLLHGALGPEEALRYWWSCTEGTSYRLPETSLEQLSAGMFAAVISKERVASVISSVYRSNKYILDPYGALAYGALSDYRARIGAVRMTLVLTEQSPSCMADLVAEYVRISPDELTRILAKKP